MIEQGRHIGEGSRMVVHRRFREVGLSEGEGVAILIYKKQKELCKFFGIKRLYIATTGQLMRVLRSRGLPFETVKKQKIHDLLTGKPVSIEIAILEMDTIYPELN